MSTVPPVERTYVGPAFADATVHDAMRVGVVSCRPETKLADVARIMDGYGIHSVVVSDVTGEALTYWGERGSDPALRRSVVQGVGSVCGRVAWRCR